MHKLIKEPAIHTVCPKWKEERAHKLCTECINKSRRKRLWNL